MRGVILSGGLGTRLRPATYAYNKHLCVVYNKPMIYYPIETLKNGGIKEIMVVTGEEHAGMFVDLLKDGRDFGVEITYGFQQGAGGIAEALKIARKFIGFEMAAVILGDNYFEDKIELHKLKEPTLFVKQVNDASRFGVYNDQTNRIVEKPKDIEVGEAVTGLYVYDGKDLAYIDTLTPSARGELEITDFNNYVLAKRPDTTVHNLRGFWSDMGTPDSLLRTANFIKNGQTAWKRYPKSCKGLPYLQRYLLLEAEQCRY